MHSNVIGWIQVGIYSDRLALGLEVVFHQSLKNIGLICVENPVFCFIKVTEADG